VKYELSVLDEEGVLWHLPVLRTAFDELKLVGEAHLPDDSDCGILKTKERREQARKADEELLKELETNNPQYDSKAKWRKAPWE
jgi:hypothetical protein